LTSVAKELSTTNQEGSMGVRQLSEASDVKDLQCRIGQCLAEDEPS
jgi:hypothetical protein